MNDEYGMRERGNFRTIMQRTLVLTEDGSHTVAVPGMNVTYHSMHGAIQESLHVFIRAGFDIISKQQKKQPIQVFEMGLGTGLNALLTFIESENTGQPVHYTAVELFPLEPGHLQSLNYCKQLDREDLQPVLEKLHRSAWEKEITISPRFTFYKSPASLLAFEPVNADPYNLIYFDAFAPSAQPELWTKEVFEKLYSLLSSSGILVTYCSKGDVRRTMQASGFSVEKIPGPPGKREMVRALKM